MMTEDEIRDAFADGPQGEPLTASQIVESHNKTARAWEAFFGLDPFTLTEIPLESGLVISRSATSLPPVTWRRPEC
jgi:hypothetical protein